MQEIIGLPGHKIEAVDIALAETIGDTLEKHYPGWGWMVNIDSEGGVVNVVVARLQNSPRMYGYTMHLKNFANHGITAKRAVMMGGELLERANCVRGPYKAGQSVKWIEGVPLKDQPFHPQLV